MSAESEERRAKSEEPLAPHSSPRFARGRLHVTHHSVEVHNAHPTLSLNDAMVRDAVGRAAAGEGFAVVALSIVLADHAAVRALNRDWLGHDHETDVVSFPLDEDAAGRREIDGEVYVDLDTAAERAPEFGVAFEHEALRYVLHGLLHLMGHEDGTDARRGQMRELEDRYL